MLRVALENDVDVVKPAAQDAGGDECVPAVVAGAGQDDDAPAAVGMKASRDASCRLPRALHQGRSRVMRLGGAQLRNVENGRQFRCHGSIIGAATGAPGRLHRFAANLPA